MACTLQVALLCRSADPESPARQVFANERSAVIGGLPSEEDGAFFETAPAGAAALDLDAMERDSNAPSAAAPDPGAALHGPWQCVGTSVQMLATLRITGLPLQRHCCCQRSVREPQDRVATLSRRGLPGNGQQRVHKAKLRALGEPGMHLDSGRREGAHVMYGGCFCRARSRRQLR